MDQVRPHDTQRRRLDDRALLDWPTRSSSDPIRWRPRADPGQKQDTGDRIMAQKGVDHLGARDRSVLLFSGLLWVAAIPVINHWLSSASLHRLWFAILSAVA